MNFIKNLFFFDLNKLTFIFEDYYYDIKLTRIKEMHHHFQRGLFSNLETLNLYEQVDILNNVRNYLLVIFVSPSLILHAKVSVSINV